MQNDTNKGNCERGQFSRLPTRPSLLRRAWEAFCSWSLVERLIGVCHEWQYPGEPRPLTATTGPVLVEALVLVLGASDTGKSTFMKQMRYIYGDTFPMHERRRHLPHIRHNLLESLHKLTRAMDSLGVPFSTHEARDAAGTFVDMAALESCLQDDSHPLNPSLAVSAAAVWKDEGAQEVYRRGNEYHLMTNADHFITSAPRILSGDYLPSIDDILRMRYPTRSSVTHTYDVGEMRMTMHDMGGQREARGEWVSHFSHPTAILFLASLSEYDQHVEEAEDAGYQRKNRVQESLEIFEALLGYPPYRNVPVILLLNKSDVFSRKIVYHSLVHYFPGYDGPENDEEAGREYLLGLYADVATRLNRHYVYRFSEATNTENFKAVFSFVKNNISRNVICRGGLL